MGYGQGGNEILYDVTPIAILEDENIKKLKEFCSERVPVLFMSLYIGL